MLVDASMSMLSFETAVRCCFCRGILHRLEELAELGAERGQLVGGAGRSARRLLDQDLLVRLEPLDADSQLLVLLPLGVERLLEARDRFFGPTGAIDHRL